MSIVKFIVQGSAPDPYEVVFENSDGIVSSRCTCKAGMIGGVCKHRTNLIHGAVDGLIEGSHADLLKVSDWIRGSSIEAALATVSSAEFELEHAKTKLADAKRRLSQALSGHNSLQKKQ